MALPKAQLLRRAQKIKLVAMDVDGVLTNGDVLVLESGEEVKAWNAKDRLAMALVRDAGHPLRFAWITGRSSRAVTASAADLNIDHVVQKCADKKKALQNILDRTDLTSDEVAFIGDDVIDLPAMRLAGFSACPADAAADVMAHAHYRSPVHGGRGVVRDVLEFILRAQKKWDALVAPFSR